MLAEGGSIASQAATMAAALVGMLAIAYVAWKAVQRQEKGDAELAAKLKADDERAAAGLRAEMGLPPERPSDQAPKQ
jgi:hypothetical protein